jgi:hypothetical protein
MAQGFLGGRAVKAGRRPPGGAALTARPVAIEMMGMGSLSGLPWSLLLRLVLPPGFGVWDACAISSSRGFSGSASPVDRVPVISSPRCGGMEWCGRSQAGSIRRATSPTCRGS